MKSDLRQTIQNYILSVAVVIFGLWLLSDKPASRTVYRTLNHENSYVYSRAAGELPATDERTDNHKNITNLTNDSVAKRAADNNNQDSPNISDTTETELMTTGGDGMSDTAWFSGLMQKTQNITDRIINIEISGKKNNVLANVAGENSNTWIEDENSLLPQATESEPLAESTVNCSSMLYMGGNDYGRNMLVKMGCPVP